jgi:transposase
MNTTEMSSSDWRIGLCEHRLQKPPAALLVCAKSGSSDGDALHQLRAILDGFGRGFSPYPYRARNRVERFSNRIKQCRRVATRYDRLAANDLAFVQLASIRLWLRLNESAS